MASELNFYLMEKFFKSKEKALAFWRVVGNFADSRLHVFCMPEGSSRAGQYVVCTIDDYFDCF